MVKKIDLTMRMVNNQQKAKRNIIITKTAKRKDLAMRMGKNNQLKVKGNVITTKRE
jgi:hypothetical protein